MSSDENALQYPPNRAIFLRNINCPYCGALFVEGRRATKEHVIGRRFVPRGTLDKQWNLIVQACETCNSLKANLEDDISAITMLPDLYGSYAVDDPRLKAEADRKATNARSRWTGKSVGDSNEKLQIKSSFGPATFTFDLIGPPQIEDARIFQLARFHVDAFFFLITYNSESRRGGFFLGEYRFLTFVRRGDWGNSQMRWLQMRWFMNLKRNWDHRLLAIGADGFFKISIRKHRDGINVWSWAVEWNRDLRVVGFVGEVAAIDELSKHVPPISAQRHDIGPNEWMVMRTEEALPAADDDLFAGNGNESRR